MSENAMKVCLVNIRDMGDPINQPALSLLYLAAYVREHLEFPVEIKIVESHDPLAEIRRFKPDVVGFTSFSVIYKKIVDCARALRSEMSGGIVIGGHHISGAPRTLDAAFDAAVLYEGEETFAEVLSLMRAGEFEAKRASVRGIAYRGPDGTVVSTARRDAIIDMDLLPLPAFDLLENASCMQFNYGTGWKRTLPLITSRGCPHKCTFCSSSAFWRKVRWLSAERLIQSIEEMVEKYKISRIQLVDDMFIWPPERFRKVHEYLLKSGLGKKISFRGAARCDLMSEEVARMLKEIRFETVGFGIEFGSQRNLDYTRKHATVEQNRQGLLACRRVNLDTGSGFIIGVPGETEEDLRQTYEFIKDMPVDIPELYVLTPYPGTPLYAQLEAEGTEYQRAKLKDYAQFRQGPGFLARDLFFASWRVKVPEIWTNPSLPAVRYRYWVLKIARLIFLRKVKYLLRLVGRNWSLSYLATLARYISRRSSDIPPEAEICWDD